MKFDLEIKLKLYSFSKIALNNLYTNLLRLTTDNQSIIKRIFLPTKIKKFCVLRSPFKHKDSREQFEIRFYKEIIYLRCNYLFLNKLLEINFPFGIDFKLFIS